MKTRTSVLFLLFIFSLVSCTKEQIMPPIETPSPTPTNVILQSPTATVVTVTPLPTEIIHPRSDCENLPINWKATSTPAGQDNEHYASLPVSDVSMLEPEEIALALCCQYVEKYHSSSAKKVWQVEDYKIQIRREKYLEGQGEIVVYVMFYVIPSYPSITGWRAGASMAINDGWIMNGSYVRIRLDDDIYVITSFWNG